MNHLKLWLQMYLQPAKFKTQFVKFLCDNPQTDIIPCLNEWLKKTTPVPAQQLNYLQTWCAEDGQGIVTYAEIPVSLRSIADPPLLLFYQGNLDLLNNNMLAVVGSRKPSPAGMENTDYFIRHIRHDDLAIISGLALGIDALAHKAALASKKATIAVLGCGLNQYYPKANRFLQSEIREKGLLLSEYHPEAGVKSWHFPRRNRIISGLSEGVLIIEAALKSGSLVTAKIAAEQGRQVLAVPGDINNPMVQGCHYLIREGALMVTSPSEVQEAIAWLELESPEQSSVKEPLNSQEKQLLKVLDRSPKLLDQIIHYSGMELALVLDLLFSLELRGIIASSIDGYYKPSRGNFDL